MAARLDTFFNVRYASAAKSHLAATKNSKGLTVLTSTALCLTILANNYPTWNVLQIENASGSPVISISGPKESSLAAQIIAQLQAASIGLQPENIPHNKALNAELHDDEIALLTIQLADVQEFLSLELGFNGPSTWSITFEGIAATKLLEAMTQNQKMSPKSNFSWVQTRDSGLKCYIRYSSGKPARIISSGL